MVTLKGNPGPSSPYPGPGTGPGPCPGPGCGPNPFPGPGPSPYPGPGPGPGTGPGPCPGPGLGPGPSLGPGTGPGASFDLSRPSGGHEPPCQQRGCCASRQASQTGLQCPRSIPGGGLPCGHQAPQRPGQGRPSPITQEPLISPSQPALVLNPLRLSSPMISSICTTVCYPSVSQI